MRAGELGQGDRFRCSHWAGIHHMPRNIYAVVLEVEDFGEFVAVSHSFGASAIPAEEVVDIPATV